MKAAGASGIGMFAPFEERLAEQIRIVESFETTQRRLTDRAVPRRGSERRGKW